MLLLWLFLLLLAYCQPVQDGLAAGARMEEAGQACKEALEKGGDGVEVHDPGITVAVAHVLVTVHLHLVRRHRQQHLCIQ